MAEWLAGIADRELAHLDRRGAVDASARRRLGMAALQPGAGFADALEEELVAAARFLATRRRGPVRLPRLGRPALIAVAVLAVAAGAAFALTRGGDAEDELGDAPPPPPPNATFAVVAMQRLTSCDRPGSESLARSGDFTGFSVFQRPQRGPDALPFAPRRLPIGAYDARATRLVAQSRPEAAIRVVPSSKIAVYGRCGTDDGPGACLVAADRTFRCFPISDMRSGRAVARTPEGRLVGMVPDDVGRVTLSVAGPSARADVADNVFEVQLDAIRGTEVELAMQRADGCVRGVAPELLRRIGILRGPDQPTLVLPAAALGALRDEPLDAVVADAARFWGTRDDVDFWVVPVVPGGREQCAPATRACVVAVPPGARPAANCVLTRGDEEEEWRLSPLVAGRTGIYGFVPDGVTAARVTIDGVTGDVEARANVVAGVLPFPYAPGADSRVELLR